MSRTASGCPSAILSLVPRPAAVDADEIDPPPNSPAINLVRRNTTPFWRQEHFPLLEPLTAESVELVAAAAIAHCDADDEVVDGIISWPESCAFDPGVLLCGAGTVQSSHRKLTS